MKGNSLIVLCSWVAALIILFVDSRTPLGYADCLLYSIPALLIATFTSLRITLISVVIFTLFIVAGFLLSPPLSIPSSLSIFNISCGILTLWIIASVSVILRQTQIKKAKSGELFHILADNIPQLIWIANAEGKMFWFNKQWFDYTGTSFEQMEKLGIKIVLHPDHCDRLIQFMEQAMKRGEPWHETVLVRRFDGEFRWFLSNAMPIRNQKRIIERWVVTKTDITEHIEFEKRLRDECDFSSAIFEAQDTLMIILDNNFKISRFNRASEQVTHYTREEMIGKFFWELITVENREKVKHQLIDLLHLKKSHELENYILVKPNGRRFIRWQNSVLRDQFNNVECIIISGIDLTDRIEAEKVVNHLNSALRMRASELETTNRELETFSYSVSHDLRSPLMTVMGFSKLVAEEYYEQLDDVGKDLLQRIYFGARKMNQLINDIMNLSKISRQEIKKEEVDLSALANDVVKDLRQSDPEREIEIIVMAGCKATGDPDLIKIALVNILGNAWKYTRRTEKPCIEFGCKKNDDKCIYFIKDNGTGFDMSIAADIFKPFKRLHKESEFAGTGIGLSIVEKVIQKHGGEIWAESEPGKGATFFFTLTVQM